MSKLHELYGQGQSVWIDFIRRSFIASGELKNWLDKGVRGVTSNPTIFHKAITGSNDYDVDLALLARQDKSIEQVYEALVLDDIARAADIEYPLWLSSEAGDGFVSIEVSPHLAHDTAGTIAEARRLFATLAHPNVMIKVPATPAGIPAIETLISDGININVTLIFGREQYRQTAEAYIAGLQKRLALHGDITRLASVASVFVSRLDTLADPILGTLGAPELLGTIALANAKLTYVDFQQLFSGERWERLAAQGARVQRPLWASTGTKNPSYPDTLYVDNLVGAYTVNTIPPATLDAVIDHGKTKTRVGDGVLQAQERLERLANLGINLFSWTEQLLREGVSAFSTSYDSLLASIQEKCNLLRT
jgi:transaldolase